MTKVQHDITTAAEKWTRRFSHISAWVVLGFPLSVCVLLPNVFQLQNKNDIELWLGDQDASVQEFQKFQEEFGVGDSVLIAFDECAANDARLEQAAKRIDGLRAVRTCWTPQRLIAAGQRFGNLQIAARLRQVAPLVGSHSRFSGMLVEVTSDRNLDRKKLLATLKIVTQKVGFDEQSTHWGGAPVINVALDQWAEDSLKQYLPAVAVIGMVCLWWSVRHLWVIFCVFFSGAYSVLVTLALMAVTGASMNLIAIALPPMIFVLSLSFSIHLIHHWKSTDTSAVGFAVLYTFRPTLLAACTTAIGSLSLATSQFTPVRNFGVWGAVGTIVAFAVTYLWLPANLVREKRKSELSKSSIGKFALSMRPRSIVGLWPLLVILAVVGLLKLEAETDGLRMLPGDSRTMYDYRLIERRLTGLLPVEIIIHQSADSTLSERITLTRHVAAYLRKNRNLESVSDATSLYPQESEQAAAVMQQLAHEKSNAFAGHVTTDGLNWRVTAYVASNNGGVLNRIVNDLKTDLSSHANVTVTGLVPLIVAAQREIFRSLAISLMAAAGVLFVTLWIAQGSLTAAGVIVLLNVTPVALVFGLLGWIGHPINMATLTTASIALGVALDDTMHLLENFRVQCKSRPEQSVDEIVRATLERCVSPMVQTTLIAGSGMAVLAFSPFVPIAEFGSMIAVLLGFALLGDTILLPAILRTSLGNCLR